MRKFLFWLFGLKKGVKYKYRNFGGVAYRGPIVTIMLPPPLKEYDYEKMQKA